MKYSEFDAILITKYNPDFRDENRVYLKNEWTCVSEIGKIFDGKEFTIEEYLYIEQKYIDAIKLIMLLGECDELSICSLEIRRSNISPFQKKINHELLYYFLNMENNQKVSISMLPFIMRIILRRLAWCELVNDNKRLFITFDSDYYMAVNTDISKNVVKHEVEKLGLFVEF